MIKFSTKGRRRHTWMHADGMAVLEAVALLLLIAGIITPIIGVIDLLITQQQLRGVVQPLTVDNNIKAFRLFSGMESWYTRPIDGADERAQQSSDNSNLRYKTEAYHRALDIIADRAELQTRAILGSRCRSTDCEERYRVEVRVVVPYIVFDSARLIRITCFGNTGEELYDEEPMTGAGCPHGRVNDVREDASHVVGRHRFLRIRGALMENDRRFADYLIESIREQGRRLIGDRYVLAHLATPSGVAGVRHLQNYGNSDYLEQHGYNPAIDPVQSRSEMHPDFVRHIMILGIRVYIDSAGTPAGSILELVRTARMEHEQLPSSLSGREAVLFEQAVMQPRQDF